MSLRVCGALLILGMAPTATAFSGDGAYRLGPDDKLLFRSAQVKELNEKQFTVSKDGFLDLPLVGRVRASGLRISEVQASVAKLAERYYYDASVALEAIEYGSQPVSVLGAVTSSGIYQLQGRSTLAEVLSLAGGLRPEAGYSVRITRHNGDDQTLEYPLREILQGGRMYNQPVVRPHDVVTVPPADVIYVIGEVRKPGGFALADKEHISILQALAMAEGPLATAALKHCAILRSESSTRERKSIPVNVRKLIDGKAPDLPLQAADILVVRGSTARKAGIRTAEAALQTISGILIWRRP